MRFVQQAAVKPSRCAVLPQVGGSHRDGYIDTGSEMLGGGDGRWDQHVYVSVVAVKEMAAMIGWCDPAPLEARLAQVEAELEQARAELAQANRHLDAIDVLESEGFRARKRPGRRPAQAGVEG